MAEGSSTLTASSVDEPPASRVHRTTQRRHERRKRARGWVILVLCAALLAIGLHVLVVQTFFVPSGSMVPTLEVGDRMLVDKLFFVRSSIHRGDIVVFRRVPSDHDPEHPADLVKRVIGLPGETISSRGDTVYIDGKPLAEPWLPTLTGLCVDPSYDITPQKIPANHYFVMGDCRGNSADSRVWGTVPASYIVGKVFVVVWRSGHPFVHWF
jgi:signal peptidase I